MDNDKSSGLYRRVDCAGTRRRETTRLRSGCVRVVWGIRVEARIRNGTGHSQEGSACGRGGLEKSVPGLGESNNGLSGPAGCVTGVACPGCYVRPGCRRGETVWPGVRGPVLPNCSSSDCARSVWPARLGRAGADMIRLQLLKLAAQVTMSVRRAHLRFASAFARQAEFTQAHAPARRLGRSSWAAAKTHDQRRKKLWARDQPAVFSGKTIRRSRSGGK